MMDLGKYAIPVLAAWAITLVLLVGLVAQSWLAARKARDDLDRVEKDRRHG